MVPYVELADQIAALSALKDRPRERFSNDVCSTPADLAVSTPSFREAASAG